MLASKVKNNIEQYAVGPAVKELCLKMLYYFERTSVDEVGMLTYRSLARICKIDDVIPELIEATVFMSGALNNVLDPGFLFVDKDDEEFELDKKSIKDAREYGFLIHPVTGDCIYDFADRVVLYFSLSDSFERDVQDD